MGAVEYGECDICKREASLNRKYYRYNIPCDCCNDEHFEIVRYCNKCDPKPPKVVKVVISPKME